MGVSTKWRSTVKALVYEGTRPKELDRGSRSKIEHDGDVIVRVDAMTICGTRSAHPEGGCPGGDARADPWARGGGHGRVRRCAVRTLNPETEFSFRASQPVDRAASAGKDTRVSASAEVAGSSGI